MTDSSAAEGEAVGRDAHNVDSTWTNVYQLLSNTAAENPDGVALIEASNPHRRQTWTELDAAADRVARALSARGLLAGQRVGLMMGDCLELAAFYFGIARGGMIAVPVSPNADGADVRRILATAAPRLVVTDRAAVARVIEAAATSDGPAADVVVVGESGEEVASVPEGTLSFDDFIEQVTTVEPVAPGDAELIALLADSVDSAGAPRLAMLSHRALLANIGQLGGLARLALTAQRPVLCGVPMCGLYGLNAVLSLAVSQGAASVLVDSEEPDRLARVVEDFAVGAVSASAEQVAAWGAAQQAPQRLASLEVVRLVSPQLSRVAEQAFSTSVGLPVERGFGLAQAGPAISTTLAIAAADEVERSAGALGRPLTGMGVQIINSDGSQAQIGDLAQIVIAGPNLFSGYWPAGDDGPDEQGWYYTGHVGLLNADGQLTAVGRRDQVIEVAGFSVYPAEVEQVIGEVEAVKSVAVVGRPDPQQPDPQQHQLRVVVAYVEAEEADEATVTAAVHEVCAARLARFKRPAEVIVLDHPPAAPQQDPRR